MSLSNTLINQKRDDEVITHADFAQYHEQMLQMLSDTREEIKKEFGIEQNPLLAKITEALRAKHTQVQQNFFRDQLKTALAFKGRKVKRRVTSPIKRNSTVEMNPSDIFGLALFKSTKLDFR